MEKYSKEWCDKLMADRGYGIHWTGSGSIGYTKWMIDEMGSDDSFAIHAKVDIKDKNTTVELSGTPMKMFITISTGNISIEHPDFDRYETKIAQYIDSCIQSDVIQEVLAERRIKRKAP